MKKWIWILAVVLATAGGGWWVYQRRSDNPDGARGASPGSGPFREDARAQLREIEVTVEAVGEINPANSVTVKPEVSGRIQDVHVATAQFVKKGEVLVSLDDTDLRTERDAALIRIAGAKVDLDKAQRDFERNRELHASKLISQEEFDNSQTALERARNEFEKTEKDLRTVDDKLQKIRIVAPFDGTVLNVLVSRGQVVSGATSVSQGTDLMAFADLNEMIIRSHINQVDATKLSAGHQVEISVDAIPGVTMEGKVILISPLATVKNNIKGFSVDVLVTKGDERLRPGMNANLRFPVERVAEALSVPVAAVFAEGQDKVVYVKTPAGPQRRVVETGVTNYRYCQILKGVNEGESVLRERPATAPPLPETGAP